MCAASQASPMNLDKVVKYSLSSLSIQLFNAAGTGRTHSLPQDLCHLDNASNPQLAMLKAAVFLYALFVMQ